VRQTKQLQEADFGSAANKGVRAEILEVRQRKDLWNPEIGKGKLENGATPK
jgi:hypothetical protein